MSPALKKYQSREDGFTLVELLIVVLIIGVLAAIAIPVYLGIQANSHKAAVRADTNIAVKKVQVALTEGTTVQSQFGVSNGSERGETVQVKASTSSAAGTNDFMVIGNESKLNTPAGFIDYTYQYDSVTGKFSDSDAGDIPLGGASQARVTIITSSLSDANTSDSYSQQINVVNTNTSGSNTFTITGLPTGFTYSTSTGTISAPANSGNVGSYPITVSVANGNVSDSRNYTLVVNSKPTVTTANLPTGVVGSGYTSTTLAASGTPSSFTWAQPSGALPTGLTFSNTGVLSGTPTAAGSYTFGVTATNSAGTSPVKSYTVVVNQTPAITTTSLNDVSVSDPYNATIASTGSPAPTYNVTSGSLPAGINLVNSTGALTGTPTTAGTYNFSVTATNTAGSSSPQAYSLYVAPIGTSADRVPAPVTDTVFWSKVISGKLSGYRYTGGANQATSGGIIFQPGGNFLSVTRAMLPVPASHKVQVTYSAQGMTPYLVPIDANGNFVGSGQGDGTWYVWSSGNVITLPSNVVAYDVAVPNWTSGAATLSSIHVYEQ